MLKFATKDPVAERRNREHVIARRTKRRLWTLLIALGLVLAMMRYLDRRETHDRLSLLLTGKPVPEERTGETSGDPQTAITEPLADSHQDDLLSTETPPRLPAAEYRYTEVSESLSALDFSSVKDNTYFRSEEQEVWFKLFAHLMETDSETLQAKSAGTVAYAQLVDQPEAYRGKVVTILGRVLRTENIEPVANQAGITSYYRLWIAPAGGGNYPFVVYSVTLPEAFPQGDQPTESVKVHGYFFKKWSYSWDEGLGVAPVLLAKQIEWSPPREGPVPIRESVSQPWLIAGILAAATFALLVVWIAMRGTSRRRKDLASLETQQPLPESPAQETRGGDGS